MEPHALLALALRSLHDALVLTDVDGVVRTASDAVEALCGVAPADAIRRDLGVLLGAEGRSRLIDARARRGGASAFALRIDRAGGAAWLRARAHTIRDAESLCPPAPTRTA